MSLKDAIREAVDERHKQETGVAQTTASPQIESVQNQVGRDAAPDREPITAERPKGKILKVNDAKGVSRAKPSSEAGNTASNKDAFTSSNKALNTASSNAVGHEQQNGASFNEESVETAAMTVRVPRQHRIHWLISAKKQGTSLTAAITEALNARFGEPAEEA